MSDLLLGAEDRDRLLALVGRNIDQLVWDLNAIYFVTAPRTVKLEADVRIPPSPEASEYAEAACLRVDDDNEPHPFQRTGKHDYWYRIVAEHVKIINFELVRTGILMPAETVWALDRQPPDRGVLSPCDCGVLITTSQGVLPAVQRRNAFGFMNWPAVRLYDRAEALRLLDDSYNILPL
jgi:hypothetical protein